MARIVPSIKPLGGGGVRYRWENVNSATADVCEPVKGLTKYPEKSVQIGGDVVTAFAIKGGNDPDESRWGDLESHEDTPITTTAGHYGIRDNVDGVQPVVTTGTNVDITLDCK